MSLRKLYLIFVLLYVNQTLFCQSFEIRTKPFYTSTYQGLEIKLVPEFSSMVAKGSFGNNEYIVRLTSLGVENDMFGPPTFIDYKGKRYYKNDFDDQLQSYFENLKVISVDVLHTTQSFKDCEYLQGWNFLKVGQKFSGFCEPKDKNNISIEISDLIIRSMSGVRELQKKIDEIENDIKNKNEKIKKLEREASQYFDQKDYESAIANYEEILLIEPNNVLAKRNIAKAENELKINNSANNGSQKSTKNKNSSNTFVENNLSRAYRLDNEAKNLISQGKIAEGLNKYNEAQRLSFSPQRAKVIENYSLYNGVSQLSEGVNQLFENMDQAIKEIDPDDMLSWKYLMIGYEKSFSDSNLEKPIPESIYLGVNIDLFVFLNLQFRSGWMQTPSIIYNVEGRATTPSSSSYNSIPEQVSINQNGYFAGMSLGLNIPLSALWQDKRPYFLLSANYGYDWMFTGKQQVTGNEFMLSQSNDFDYTTPSRLTISLAYQFPKSKIGLSFFYTAYKIKPIESSKDLDYTGENSFYKTRTFRTTEADLFNPNQVDSYSTFGISLIKLFGSKRK